jgi:hypothetical protein
MPQKTDYDQVHQSIADLVGRPQAHGLVAAYFDPDRGFAGAMFDGLDPNGLLADNPADRFTVDDIAATSLLDVRFGPTAVRALLGSQDIAMALKAVPERLPLWKADEPELQVASRLWFLVRDIRGVGRTRASKLLARKRPQFLPIVDSVIAEALQLHVDMWRPLAEALKGEHLRHAIDDLRPEQVSQKISTLRLLDVLVWMSCSRSRAAVEVQIELGVSPTRDLPRRRRTVRPLPSSSRVGAGSTDDDRASDKG